MAYRAGLAQPNIALYVVPLGSGYHAAAAGSFSILRFAPPDLPDVVYLEQLTGALYLDKRRDVDHYAAVMDQLCVQAAAAARPGDAGPDPGPAGLIPALPRAWPHRPGRARRLQGQLAAELRLSKVVWMSTTERDGSAM